MTDYLSLPIELPKKILAEAFKDTLSQDIIFDLRLAGTKWFLELQNARRETWKACPAAPHIHDLARGLVEVHPQLADDMKFVLKQVLRSFEEMMD